MEQQLLLTVPQAAAWVQTAPKHLYRLIAAGDLRALRVGRKLRLDPTDVRAYLARQSQQPDKHTET